MPKLWLTAKRSSLTARLDLVVLIAGELAVALGSVVLFGWYTHSPWLVQVRPTFAPMQYNAALSVLLCGLGLLALSWERVRLEVVCGIVVAAIGLLTLYEYIFGLSLGLDQFFLQPFTTVRTSHPGRMAPQTALSCFLTGTVLVILRLPARHGLIRLLPHCWFTGVRPGARGRPRIPDGCPDGVSVAAVHGHGHAVCGGVYHLRGGRDGGCLAPLWSGRQRALPVGPSARGGSSPWSP